MAILINEAMMYTYCMYCIFIESLPQPHQVKGNE